MILRNKLLIKLMSPGLWVLCFFHARGRGGAGEVGGKGGGNMNCCALPGRRVVARGVRGRRGGRRVPVAALRRDGERGAVTHPATSTFTPGSPSPGWGFPVGCWSNQ